MKHIKLFESFVKDSDVQESTEENSNMDALNSILKNLDISDADIYYVDDAAEAGFDNYTLTVDDGVLIARSNLDLDDEEFVTDVPLNADEITKLKGLINKWIGERTDEGKQNTFEVKPYVKDMIETSVDNCYFMLNAIEAYQTDKQSYTWGVKSLESTINSLASKISNVTGDFVNLPAADQAALLKKMKSYTMLDLANAKRRDREYSREERAYSQSKKLLGGSKLDVTYEGDADKELLDKVISRLRLQKFIKPKSKIEIQSRTRRKDGDSLTSRTGGHISVTEIWEEGYITIDGIDHEFDIQTDQQAYDHFPES